MKTKLARIILSSKMEGNANNQKAWGLTTQTKLIWSYYALPTLRNALGKQGSVKGLCTHTHTHRGLFRSVDLLWPFIMGSVKKIDQHNSNT